MVTEENDMRHGLRKMAALLAGALLLTLAGCGQEAAGPENSAGTGGIPAAQTSSEDFQKNMHQSSALRLRRNKLYETEEGIFFQMGSVVRYLDKETKRETILCGKPECTHEDESCNAYLDATNLWMYNGRFYFDNSDYIEENGTFVNKGDRIYSASIDGTDRQVVQYLEFEPGGDTAHAVDPILHRGIVYFGYNGVLYSVPLGEDISKAEKLWGEEILDDGSPFADFNALHLDLWADGDTVYFMANLEQPDGTYKDTLFAYDTGRRCGGGVGDHRRIRYPVVRDGQRHLLLPLRRRALEGRPQHRRERKTGRRPGEGCIRDGPVLGRLLPRGER